MAKEVFPSSSCSFSHKENHPRKFFLQQPELLAQNLSQPLRDKQQFWPVSLAHHLEIKAKIGFLIIPWRLLR